MEKAQEMAEFRLFVKQCHPTVRLLKTVHLLETLKYCISPYFVQASAGCSQQFIQTRSKKNVLHNWNFAGLIFQAKLASKRIGRQSASYLACY